MPSTTNYSFPYPSLAEDPNVPGDMQALAESMDAALSVTDASAATLAARVTALEAIFGTAGAVAVAATSTSIATTTSVSYSESWTGGSPVGVEFVVPPSGKILVHNSSYVDNNGASGRTYFSWVLRTGSIVGSGTIVAGANDGWSLENFGVGDMTAGRSTLVTGLTPGADYNVRQAMKQTGGTTAESQNRHLCVEPVWK